MLIAADRILLPSRREFVPGWVEVRGETIAAAGEGRPPRPADEVLRGALAPGYVDVHCHGGGGAAFATDDPSDVDTAIATHRTAGTTSIVASLITASVPNLHRQVALLARRVRDGDLAGIHLEGPWLAPSFKGAHSPALLADPIPDTVAALLAAAAGTIRMVTIAPELPGAMEAIRVMLAHDCLPAIGHTAANYATTKAAIEAGATGVTHIFNAMPPLGHRDPGPILAFLDDPRTTVELIFDGIHVNADLAAYVMRMLPDRVVLITDAMAAAGAPDGDYMLGELPVEVRERVARLAGLDTIAGSTLTLARAVRTAVAQGIPLAQAVLGATSLPAEYLNLHGVGRIAAGTRADLVTLDDEADVTGVMYRGTWQ
ncbi:N-acetylglucosamine-6-phosphate deacetylase [Tessaracoccus sp. G1721]